MRALVVLMYWSGFSQYRLWRILPETCWPQRAFWIGKSFL